MSVSLVMESFGLSLITNVIVMLGATAMFFWIRSAKVGSLIGKHKKVISILFIYFFYAYLYGQSVANVTIGQQAYGMHWTFLNMLIVTAFVFNIMMKSMWVTGCYVLGTTLFVFTSTAGTVHILPVIIFWLANIGMQVAFYKYGYKYFIESRMKSFAALFIYALIGFFNVYVMTPEYLDRWFFVRQALAFVVIAVISCEFTRAIAIAETRAAKNKKMARIDAMTDVKNFGAFNHDLVKLYQDYKQTGKEYSLLEVDIDHFKTVNDRFGHLMGNQVLEETAKTMKTIAAGCPNETNVYRVGGEEFCMIITAPTDSPNFETDIACRLKRAVGKLVFTTEDQVQFTVTISVGQEYISAKDNHYLDIYNQADKYLYMSKQAGRNKVTVRGQIMTP